MLNSEIFNKVFKDYSINDPKIMEYNMERNLILTRLQTIRPDLFETNIRCGGKTCHGGIHCKQAVLIRKDPVGIYDKENCEIVCCFIAGALNKGISRDNMGPCKTCVCGSGLLMRICLSCS